MTAEPDELNGLLEASWSERERRLPRRELVFEAGLLVLLVAGCVSLLMAGGPLPHIEPGVIGAVAAYSIASRVAYPLGAGNLVPTQPFLLVLFALAPPAAVPLLVCGALAVATLVHSALGRTHPERMSFAGGDALHALGPALVFVAFGIESLTAAPIGVLLAALAAQAAFDLASSTVREWVASGVKPRLQAKVIGQVCAVDVSLAPLGYLASLALQSFTWAPVALVPLVGLLSYTARERLRSVGRAHERLLALERERSRLRVAVGRVGEAFATNLDVDALLTTVTRVAVEAVDADAGCTTLHIDGCDRVVHSETRTGANAANGLAAGDRRALACGITDGDECIATLVVSRATEPFNDDDAALIAYLCEQASVAAANALRHERLREQATVDEMTGLVNHRRFQELLTDAVDAYGRDGTMASLALFDLDNFKRLNDRFGHLFGDAVLRRVGQCMREHTRQGDQAARYGGEELAIVLAGADAESAHELAERIRRAVADLSFATAEGEPVQVTLSAGVASLDSVHPTREMVVRAADRALYAAKRRGRNCVIVAGSEEEREPAASTPVGDDNELLPKALHRDELLLEFQPITELSTGRTVALEALVRWQHPHKGLVGPDDFLPWAEREGLMPALGHWVLAEAFQHAARWLSTWPGFALTVNVSASQVMEPDFAEQVGRLLTLHGMPPESLILELTETAMLHDVAGAVKQLAALRSQGVRVAIDDFGTGFAGIDHLLSLPVDLVKIPRPYVSRLDGPSPRDRILCEHLIGLVQSVGLGVVAEGVERPEQRTMLADLGVDLAQGFLWSRALSSDAVPAWLDTDRTFARDELARRRLARTA